MNLTSCGRCGVVLDRNNMEFPYVFDDDGELCRSDYIYRDGDFIATAPCPVCESDIPERDV